MMIRRDVDLLDLAVVSIEDASVLGGVDGLILDDAELGVAGFLIDLGLYEAKVLPIESAIAIGNDAIIVETGAAVSRLSENRGLEVLAGRGVTISDAEAITVSGESVGAIGGFLVDTTTGRIAGVEFFPEEQPSCRYEKIAVPVSAVRRVGPDIVVLADDFRDHVPAGGSLLGLALAGGSTDTMVTPKVLVSEFEAEPSFPSKPSATVAPGPESCDPGPEEAAESGERHFLVGRTVLRNIVDPSGEIIARAGETVTPEMILRARSSDQFLVLSLNVD